jgi:hypothetical protein
MGGFIYTLKELAGYNPIIESAILKQSVYDFYMTLQLMSQKQKVEKEYHTIMSDKARAK